MLPCGDIDARFPFSVMPPGRSTRMDRRGIGVSMSAIRGREEHKQFCGTIHSGQFMVSHFEAEGQEDEDDEDLAVQVVEDVKPAIVDTVISNIISKRNPELSMPSISSSNVIAPLRSGSAGWELNRPVQRRQPLQLTSPHMSSQVEIDTDLSTVFNTLKIAYTHKLTSPKWNLFKGIRLRWKEKIRLNNVIWRCWHMQFVMKQNTLVCPFAAPFEVDVHKTPQSILLEGKYWKRKCNVITAEYKKWRRFYVSKALDANNIVDTTSELDFLEWSPRSSESLFLVSDSMPNDTLISTLSQYPFSSSRDLAPGISRAEFIQPSLAQLEDLMELDFDFLNVSRLPSVPEEGSEDYPPSIDSTIGQPSSMLVSSVPVSNRSSGITGPGSSPSINQQHQQQQSSIVPSTIDTVVAQILTDPTAALAGTGTATAVYQQQPQLVGMVGSYPTAPHLGQQPAIVGSNVPVVSGTSSNTTPSDEVNKNSKPKTCRSLYKPLGRAHNYDRCEPTTHQRLAYNLVSQPHVNENTPNDPYQPSPYQIQPGRIIQVPGTPSNQNSLNYIQPQTPASPGNPMNLPSNTIAGTSSNSNMLIQSPESKPLTHSQSLPIQNQVTNQTSPRSVSMPATQTYPPLVTSQNALQGAMVQQHQRDAFKGFVHPQTSSYKSYHSLQTPYKIPSQNPSVYGNTGRSMRHPSPPHGHQPQNVGSNQQPSMGQSQQQLQDLQLQQQHQSSPQSQRNRLSPHPSKEMIRSNSLPSNVTFAVPRTQIKQSPSSRSRSNSTATKQPGNSSHLAVNADEARGFPGLFPAHSESALARLLTTNDTSRQQAFSGLSLVQKPYGDLFTQQQQQQQQFTRYQQPSLSNPLSPASSPLQLSLSQPNLQLSQSQADPLSQGSVLSFAPSPAFMVVAPHDMSSDSPMESDTNPLSPVGSLSGLSSDANNTSFCSSNAGSHSTRPSKSSTRACGNSTCSGDCSTCTAGCGTSSGGGASHRAVRSDSQRKSGHLHAEQKRRYNIKSGFDVLHSLIPQLQQNPTAKLSKAAMLQKGADYIKQLRSERDATSERINGLRRELNALNASVSNLQTSLPASGAPLPRQRPGHAMEQFQQNVRQGSLVNWKYWIFGLIFEPMMLSFDQNVSDASLEELCRSSALWVDQHCSLVETRPAVSSKLCQLSTQTDILADPPTSLKEEVMKAIAKWLADSSPKSEPGSSSGKRDDNDPNSPKSGHSGYK